MALLLPPIHIPIELGDYIVDFDAPLTAEEFHLNQRGQLPTPLPKLPRDPTLRPHAEINAELEHQAWQLFAQTQEW